MRTRPFVARLAVPLKPRGEAPVRLEAARPAAEGSTEAARRADAESSHGGPTRITDVQRETTDDD